MSFSFLPRRQGLLLRAPWLLAVVAAACGDQTDEARDFISPTRLVVDPADFLGSVPCGSGQGAMRQYQATLVDVTDGLDRTFVLPSSRLVGCDRTVTFDFVEPGRSYIARITGFDRSDLEERAVGVPVVLDDTGSTVLPQWSTTCWGDDGVDYSGFRALGGAPSDPLMGGAGGGVSLGATAYLRTAITIRGCDPLASVGDAPLGSVRVDLTGALAGLSCGNGPGEVARFEVDTSPGSPSDDLPPGDGGASSLGGMGGTEQGGPPTRPGAACDGAVLLKDLPAGLQLQLTVLAFEAGKAEPRWSSSCWAFTKAGTVIAASCDPLVDID